MPRLPRALATVIVYTAVVLVLVVVIVLVAGALATSIGEFVATIPQIRKDLPDDPQAVAGLAQLGRARPDRHRRPGATPILANLDVVAGALVQPLQQIAVASVSVIGTMLIVFFLSIYMVVDRDLILAFLFRIVPPSYAEEARLLQTSVSRSFGGFLRGQALMGVTYFVIALVTSIVMGLPLVAADLGVGRASSRRSRSSDRSCPGRRR